MLLYLKYPHLLLSTCLYLAGPCSLFAQNSHVIDSLAKALMTTKTDSTKVTLLFQIGRENWFSRNVTDAAYYLNKSVEKAEQCKYFVNQADAYNLLANIYMKQEAFDIALACLDKALEQKNERFIPLIHDTYSKVYYQLGDYQSSLEYAYLAAEGCEKSKDPQFNMQSVFAYLMVGDIFSRLKQDERAFHYYQKAYMKARTSTKNWYIKSPIQRIANYYLLQNEFEKAIHLYDTILIIDKDAPSFEPTMYSYEGLGNVAMKQQKYKTAIANYKQALHYATQKNLAISIENFYTRLGEAFLAQNQKDSANHYLQYAISLSKSSKSYNNLSAAYFQLSALQQQKKEHEKALTSYQLYKIYHDSLINVEKIRAVNNLEILHRTRQKEHEILRLQKTEQEKDFAIKIRNAYIIIGGVLIVFLGIIIFLVIRNYRNKQYLQDEKVKQLQQQQQVISLQSMINGQEAERTRIAKDLHDGLGGLFSTVKMYLSTLEHENETLKSSELFQKSFALLDTASVELRRIAHNMMPEVLMKMGLINAVKDMCNHISVGKLLRISLEVHGLNTRLNPNIEVMLYRIIQELLNNIIKHAQATEAIIQFIKDNQRLSVIVEDNGKGFDTQETDEEVHTGLSTIKSRVNYLSGQLTIDSGKDTGTTIMMDFLINEL
jgi:two-component system NarL family sensor kinase